MSQRLVLAGLLFFILTLGGAEAAMECDDPTPLVVTSATVQGNVITITISNPTSSVLQGYIFGTVHAGGYVLDFYGGPVTIEAQSSRSFTINLLRPITLLEGIGICGGLPDGVSDTSDPIVVQVNPEE